MKVTEKPDGTVEVETGRSGGAAKATWDGQTIAVGPLLKADDERRFSLHVIYPAMRADIGKALDGHRDFAQPDVVERACWKYMREYRHVGAYHTEEQAAAGGGVLKADGAADLVECSIYRNPVPWVVKSADGTVIATVEEGDWTGGFIWTPEEWELLKAGRDQVSVEGGAVRKPASPEAIAKLRS